MSLKILNIPSNSKVLLGKLFDLVTFETFKITIIEAQVSRQA